MGWGDVGDDAAKKTDQELKDEELDILSGTTVDWDTLKPSGTDDETYNKLMAAVKEAQIRNEDIAQLQSRITSLGGEAVKLAKKLTSLAL